MLGSGIGHAEFFGIMYDKYQNKCNWLTFFDFDEYLVLFSEERKELSLKEFLSNKKFDHCDAIEFNWVNYGDNNLYYYDNRSSIERFTEPNFDDYSNRFVKSIIRGYLNKKVFIPGRTNHQPIRYIKLCNSKGEIASYYPDCLIPPIYKYGYLKHFHTRTADEYADKVVRGHPGNQALDINERFDLFFSKNRFSEEKLKILEKKFNRTFNYIHWKKN